MAIHYTAHAARKLIQNIHADGTNEGCVITFGEQYTCKQALTADPILLYNSLTNVESLNANAAGRILYDAVFNVIEYFCKSANASNAWVVFVITHENDAGSEKLTSVGECSKYVLDRYHGKGCIYTISVGIFNRFKLNRLNIDDRCRHISADTPLNVDGAFLKALLLFQKNTIAERWSDVKAFRNTSYAVVVDVSSTGFAGDIPAHVDKLCFNGHILSPLRYGSEWWCSVCGKESCSKLSMYNCSVCDFDACSHHCTKNGTVDPLGTCHCGHSLRYVASKSDVWTCNTCRKSFRSTKNLQCNNCNKNKCKVGCMPSTPSVNFVSRVNF